MTGMSIAHAPWLQGLGKTVQVIAVLAYLVESRGTKEPSLIVCPSSVLSNWQAELQAWAPGLCVLLHQGSAPERKACLAQHVSTRSLSPALAEGRARLKDTSWHANMMRAWIWKRSSWGNTMGSNLHLRRFPMKQQVCRRCGAAGSTAMCS